MKTDMEGYSAVWISVDGCEEIWMDMNRCGWTWMDVGKCIFQKIAQKKIQPPPRAVELSFFFGMVQLWNIHGILMKYERNMHRIFVEYWWDAEGICMK